MNRALTVAQVATLLQASVPILKAELAALPEPVTHFCPAAGEWSVSEVSGHLIETEARGFAGRIQRILMQPGYVCAPWDPLLVARDRRDNEKSAAALFAQFTTWRAESVVLLQTLTAEQLVRTAEHPVVGLLSINDLLHEWVFHDRNHVKQIMSNLQALVYVTSCNTHRFTTRANRSDREF